MIPSFLAALPLGVATLLSPEWTTSKAVFIPVVLLTLALVWLFRFPGRKVTKIHPMRASTFQPELVPKHLDTIVIGSGSGGCACANLLAQSGHKVLLLEQHYRTGGCTHSFRDHGCEWDTGLHYTAMAMSDRTERAGALLNFMTKGMQRWTKLDDPYDEVLFPLDDQVKPGLPNKQNYPFVTGADNTIASVLQQIDPSNTKLQQQMERWMDMCRTINDGFTALGLSRILPKWMHFLIQKRIDRLMKYASYTVRDVQYGVFNCDMTPEQLLQSCPKAPPGVEPDPVLRRIKAVLTHPIGDYAVQPRDATFAAHGITMAHYMDGAAYTVGATQGISIRSSSLLREMGGEVLADAAVQEIIVENGRAVGVRVTNTSALAANAAEAEQGSPPVTTEIRAKNVVCATSIYNLYNKLLPQDHPVVKDFQNPAKRSVIQSNGHIFLFCKIKGDADDLGLPTHNLWYFNDYDLDQAFDRYFAKPREERPPTVYIGFPCTKDTTWKKRFPGVSNSILISDGLWEWFEKWQDTPVHNRGADYEGFKKDLAKHLLDILYETVPEAKGKVEFFELGTPLSEVTYLSSWHGGSYGTKCIPEMFATINHGWTTTPHTHIPGLYLAGSDAFLPAVCGAMYGGCFGAAAVLGHFGTLRMLFHFIGDFAASLKQENPKLSWAGAYVEAFRRFVSVK